MEGGSKAPAQDEVESEPAHPKAPRANGSSRSRHRCRCRSHRALRGEVVADEEPLDVASSRSRKQKRLSTENSSRTGLQENLFYSLPVQVWLGILRFLGLTPLAACRS
jgi:hypothetical protein